MAIKFPSRHVIINALCVHLQAAYRSPFKLENIARPASASCPTYSRYHIDIVRLVENEGLGQRYQLIWGGSASRWDDRTKGFTEGEHV